MPKKKTTWEEEFDKKFSEYECGMYRVIEHPPCSKYKLGHSTDADIHAEVRQFLTKALTDLADELEGAVPEKDKPISTGYKHDFADGHNAARTAILDKRKEIGI